MNRREFFRWLAAASGAALLEPGMALGSSTDDRVEDEIWAWLHPRASAMQIVSFDVSADRDTVLVLAAGEASQITSVFGLRAFVGTGEVIVESIRNDRIDYDLSSGSFDLSFFTVEDCFYCPFDCGCIGNGETIRIRMRRCPGERDPVRVGLAVCTNSLVIPERSLPCEVTIGSNLDFFDYMGDRQ